MHECDAGRRLTCGEAGGHLGPGSGAVGFRESTTGGCVGGHGMMGLGRVVMTRIHC